MAWNLMGGTVDWAALDLMAELLGVDDIEGWIYALTQIRDYQIKRRDDDQS